jgi:hypothetical protein
MTFSNTSNTLSLPDYRVYCNYKGYIAVIHEKKVGVVILLNKNISNGAVVTADRSIIGIGE